MPLYDYTCTDCNHQKTVLQRADDPSPVCPTCPDSLMVRGLCAPSFNLKGSGFYKPGPSR